MASHDLYTDVDITRRTSDTGYRLPESPEGRERKLVHDDTSIDEHEINRLRISDGPLKISRRRGLDTQSPRGEKYKSRVRAHIRNDENKTDHYARKSNERAYIRKAYKESTKGWKILDVPPGTERVRVDGDGTQEISWQKYNGVRRSKFTPELDSGLESVGEKIELRDDMAAQDESTLEIDISGSGRVGGSYEGERERIEENSSDSRVGLPRAPPPKADPQLWTEFTKDLVAREAIEELGYEFEETEFFYYINQYLPYVSFSSFLSPFALPFSFCQECGLITK